MPILIGLAKVLVAWAIGLFLAGMIEYLRPTIQKAWRKFGTSYISRKIKLNLVK